MCLAPTRLLHIFKLHFSCFRSEPLLEESSSVEAAITSKRRSRTVTFSIATEQTQDRNMSARSSHSVSGSIRSSSSVALSDECPTCRHKHVRREVLEISDEVGEACKKHGMPIFVLTFWPVV